MSGQKSKLVEAIEADLAQHGPMLGKELALHHPEENNLSLWQACFGAPSIQISHFSRYYLRFDVTRASLVRLSPSILRDFLSFTLLSLPGQREQVIERQVELSNHHREISMRKIHIAQSLLMDILAELPQTAHHLFCAFIAGDLAYFLGHEEERIVQQTGDTVRGSDIDIVIVHEGLEPEHVKLIDKMMLEGKIFYLRHPAQRHEVDYICKPIETMFRQFAYGDIHEKIASKIVYESLFLAGSLELYGMIRLQMERSGARAAIEQDFAEGLEDRKRAMKALVSADPEQIDENTESLFFFSQERIEFS